MATSVRLIRRYVWLIDTIRQAKQITLEEINQAWLQERSLRLEDEGEIPERTFHRHRQAIADLFGIDILCNRFNGNTYYIDNEEELSGNSFTAWLFNGIAIDNRMLDNKFVKDYILYEKTSGGIEYLPQIIKALSHNNVLTISYTRFNSCNEKEWIIEPYGLKQSGQRWYLIGRKPGRAYLSILSLDRINSLHIEKETFERDKTVNIATWFRDVVGVNVDESFGVQPVRLRVYGNQRAYLETLPLHESQQLVAHTADYSDYELTLRPEYEFQHAVLALGPDAEILSPPWLREDMKFYATEILKRYN